MIDEAVQQLLDGFVTSVREVAPIEAVWLHGSLALGDFQLGRSDLDVVAVVSAPRRRFVRTAIPLVISSR